MKMGEVPDSSHCYQITPVRPFVKVGRGKECFYILEFLQTLNGFSGMQLRMYLSLNCLNVYEVKGDGKTKADDHQDLTHFQTY